MFSFKNKAFYSDSLFMDILFGVVVPPVLTFWVVYNLPKDEDTVSAATCTSYFCYKVGVLSYLGG